MRTIGRRRDLLTTKFASAFYDVYGNHTYQSLRICPLQYEKRAGAKDTDPGAVWSDNPCKSTLLTQMNHSN